MCCCNTRIVQLGTINNPPFTFQITSGDSPYANGAGVDFGPLTINNGDIVHFYSVNSINFEVIPGSVNLLTEVRIDPDPANILIASPAGLFVDGSVLGGVNLYNSDGSLTDPVRTVTMGGSAILWDANNIAGISQMQQSPVLWRSRVNDQNSSDQLILEVSNTQVLMSASNPGDKVAERYSTVAGATQNYQRVAEGGQMTYFDQQATFFDFGVSMGTYFEIRLNGNAGTAGEVLTSNGPGNSPYWQTLPSFDDPTLICFPNIIQNNALTRVLVVDAVNNCLAWRDVASIGGGGGGGSMNSFQAAGNIGAAQTINDGNTLTLQGLGLIQTNGIATDTIQISLTASPTNNEVLISFGGAAVWSSLNNILDTFIFNSNVSWDFQNNDWTLNNIDNWTVDANTVTINAPSICLTGITQNDALTRVLVQDVGGCLAWRDVATIGGGGGGGMTSFIVAGNSGTPQTILDTNTLSILGTGLLSSVASATDTITLSLTPGTNDQVLMTIAGVPTWGNIDSIIENVVFNNPVTWDFGGNNWTITNVNDWAVTANDISFNTATFEVTSTTVNFTAAIVCFPGIIQNDTLGRFLVQDINGCLAWRDVSSLPGAGGGITSFFVAGNSGPAQTITDSNTLNILGSGVLTAVASATDNITLSVVPGANGEVLTTSGGVAAWGAIQSILNVVNFGGDVTWDFGNNDWNINNIDNWNIDANTVTINAPSICLTGITQNDALTRILAMDTNGCLSWRSAATLGGGGGLVSANNGLSVSGSTVQLGSAAPGGAPLLFNTNIDMAGFGIIFRAQSAAMVGAPSGQATNLQISNVYGQILSSNGYDFENVFPNADFTGAVDLGFAVWNNGGVMKRVNHDQMPYHVRTVNANTTLSPDDTTIEVDTTAGDVTITLPVGSAVYNQAIANNGQGKLFNIKKSAGNNLVNIVVSGGGTIDGFASLVLNQLNSAVRVQADSPTSYIALGSHTSNNNYIGGGFPTKGNIRYVTSNYQATINDDIIIVTPGATDVTVTMPDMANSYIPTGATTGEGKKITVIHRGGTIRRTRVMPFGGVSPFINMNDHITAFDARIELQCISNTGLQETAWILKRYDYPTLGVNHVGYNNVSNPVVGIPLSIQWNRRHRSISIDYAPGLEPSVINISLGNGGLPLGPGGIDYNGQELEIHVARIGACPINIDFGKASRNGLQGAAGIVPITPGDYKWVKLHGVWGTGVSSTWLTSGDL